MVLSFVWNITNGYAYVYKSHFPIFFSNKLVLFAEEIQSTIKVEESTLKLCLLYANINMNMRMLSN